MAHVGEETALQPVQLHELAVAFLQFALVLVQFITEGEFAETKLVVKVTSKDDKDARNGNEIKIIKQDVPVHCSAVKEAGCKIKDQNLKKDDDAVQKRPAKHNGSADQDDVQ